MSVGWQIETGGYEKLDRGEKDQECESVIGNIA